MVANEQFGENRTFRGNPCLAAVDARNPRSVRCHVIHSRSLAVVRPEQLAQPLSAANVAEPHDRLARPTVIDRRLEGGLIVQGLMRLFLVIMSHNTGDRCS